MPRTGTCTVCGGQFDWPKVKGRIPTRCRSCNLKRNADRQRAWREAHPERSKEIASKGYWKRRDTPGYLQRKREDAARRAYGIEPGDFDRLARKQGGVCAICKGGPNGPGSRLHIDHCHESKRVRGLLCGRCNTLIGLAHEDVDVLRAAIRYLKR